MASGFFGMISINRDSSVFYLDCTSYIASVGIGSRLPTYLIKLIS